MAILATFGVGGTGTGNQSYEVRLTKTDGEYSLCTITISCNGKRIDQLNYETENKAREEFRFIVNLLSCVLRFEREGR